MNTAIEPSIMLEWLYGALKVALWGTEDFFAQNADLGELKYFEVPGKNETVRVTLASREGQAYRLAIALREEVVEPEEVGFELLDSEALASAASLPFPDNSFCLEQTGITWVMDMTQVGTLHAICTQALGLQTYFLGEAHRLKGDTQKMEHIPIPSSIPRKPDSQN